MAFLLFSNATSITGPQIAAELRINCGRNLPRQAPDIIINYGAGSFTVPIRTRTIINHPRHMKNKLEMLRLMDGLAAVNVPKFVNAHDVHNALRRNILKDPIIGRTNMHQAGGGYWLCLANRVVDWALQRGAQYFQQWVDIKNEYRVHVFNGDAIIVHKKILRTDPKDEFCINLAREIREERNDIPLQDIISILKTAMKHVTNPDFNIRSLHRGWKFVRDNNPPNSIIRMAIASVNASGLDFGAVDMMQLNNNSASFIELNTGPGLDVGGGAFNAYIARFRTLLNNPRRNTNTGLRLNPQTNAGNRRGGRLRGRVRRA